ncbi:arginine--tRNA ligase [bacterium]|nr:MAG: arginine--tRNA ligase [bacterium]
MQKNLQDSLITIIAKCLKSLNLQEGISEGIYLDLPADSRFGDLSTNIALRLSRKVKRPPLEIATSILSELNKYLSDNPLEDLFKEIKIEGPGFINFYFKESYFYEQLKGIVKQGSDYLKSDIGRSRKVVIEFVSANPTGPLSVAHARQAVVGDVLANIFNFSGFKVKREYYLNDEGNQITLLGKSVELRLNELSGEKIDFPDNYYQGDYIYSIARQAQQEKVRSDSLGDFAADYILETIKKELDDFGVRFDCWYSQKELAKSGKIKEALELLKEKGFLYEEGGASWFKSRQFGDDKDRVVIKSDGSYTYLTPDIAYHLDKYKRGFSWLINLWGPDHHGYINRLKAAVTALGKDPKSLSIIVVQLATIFREGKPIQMSTRKGQYITLKEILDEVGPDASRFFFLMRHTESHLDFDLDVAKKQTAENPVYYVQYAHARISSILRQVAVKLNPEELGLQVLKEKEEIDLIKKLLQFSYIIDICIQALDPYMVTVYLQELSEAFHRFYDRHRVLSQDAQLSQARLVLVQATQSLLATGLSLLGVSQPDKM